MASKLTIFRKGVFHISNPIENHKCGIEGKNEYTYEVQITCEGKLKEPQYFVIDNNDIHKYFVDTYIKPSAVDCESCELMAMKATDHFVEWFNRKENRYQKVSRISVKIFGTEHTYLESVWTKKGK